MSKAYGPAGKIADYFINSKLTPLIIIASVLLGLAAVVALPREEEPQIIVPMIDIFVQMPGARAKRWSSASPVPWKNCSGRFPAWNTSTPLLLPAWPWPW
jgi:hypothetical protein